MVNQQIVILLLVTWDGRMYAINGMVAFEVCEVATLQATEGGQGGSCSLPEQQCSDRSAPTPSSER